MQSPMNQGARISGGDTPVEEPRPATLRNRQNLRTSVIIGLICFLVYNANLRSISAADTYGARYLPFAIWRTHTVLMDPVSTIAAQGRKIAITQGEKNSAFWIVRGRGDHLVSLYPIALPVLISPLYLPAVVHLAEKNWNPQDFDRVARIMEKLSASLLAALSVALLYLLLRRRTNSRMAALLAIAYAFGTTTWVISSQGLWQHTLGELLIVAALLVMTGESARWRVIAAGIICSLTACNRPPDSLITAALLVYALWWWARHQRLAFLAGAALPMLFLAAYNFGIVGHYAGGYGLVGKATFFDHNLFYGLAVLLFSPVKGLFVFSPFLIAIPLRLRQVFADRANRNLTVAIGVALLIQLLVYAKADWRQGISWGPRWLTDLLPVLLWMLVPAVASIRGAARSWFIAACCAAIAIEAIGAFWYTGQSDAAMYAAIQQNNLAGVWNLKSAPFVAELKHHRAPADLTTTIRGNFDTIVSDGGTILHAAAENPITVEGWSLADGRTPDEVLVAVDGAPVALSKQFSPRPDVTQALGYTSPGGWRVTIPGTISPGEHLISVVIRGRENGDYRYLSSRPLRMLPGGSEDLAGSARAAATILENRQQAEGYWLTEFTNLAHFQRPHVELNVFAIATIVDILSPVAAKAGLQEALQKARRFLSNQIEPSGLVRYHGRPDAPTIGTLGCAITPDADDTSLVWRIAPIPRSDLMQNALATLDRYRTPQGLYRTWLAPRDQFVCIDPGKDPDPADAVIQMHVLMFLSQAKPSAARELCEALGRSIDHDRIWVYYRIAPLLALLRQPDLRQSGCGIRIPARRLQNTPADQAPWISAGVLLDRLSGGAEASPDAAAIQNLLRELSRNNFAVLRESPPLVYHNDLTASLPRYYWSQELGFALWLRLYYENMRLSSASPCAPDTSACGGR